MWYTPYITIKHDVYAISLISSTIHYFIKSLVISHGANQNRSHAYTHTHTRAKAGVINLREFLIREPSVSDLWIEWCEDNIDLYIYVGSINFTVNYVPTYDVSTAIFYDRLNNGSLRQFCEQLYPIIATNLSLFLC